MPFIEKSVNNIKNGGFETMKRNLIYFIVWSSILIILVNISSKVFVAAQRQFELTYDYKYTIIGFCVSIVGYIILGIMMGSLSNQLSKMKGAVKIIFAVYFIYLSLCGISSLIIDIKIYKIIYPTWIMNSSSFFTLVGSIGLGIMAYYKFRIIKDSKKIKSNLC